VEQASRFYHTLAETQAHFQAIRDCKKPVIAAVHGMWYDKKPKSNEMNKETKNTG
jgi:enoyl-CoA hydratase/carnithine racemase